MNITVVVLPTKAWDILEETLNLDCESSAFDTELRDEIRWALDQACVMRPDTDSMEEVAPWEA